MADLVVSLKAFSWEGVVVKLKTFMHRSPQISREGGSCRQQSFAPGIDAQDSNKALTHALSTSCMRLASTPLKKQDEILKEMTHYIIYTGRNGSH